MTDDTWPFVSGNCCFVRSASHLRNCRRRSTIRRPTAAGSAASLVKLGILRDEDITSILSRQYGVPSINLAEYDLDPAIVRLVPGETATKHNV